MAGPTKQRRIYDSIRREFHWLHRANDVYTTVSNCSARILNWVKPKQKRPLQLFSASGLLGVIAIGFLAQLHHAADGNSTSSTWPTDIQISSERCRLAKHSQLKNQIYSFILSNFLWHIRLRTNGQWCTVHEQAVYNLCTMLGVKHLTTAAYHYHTNGQAERFTCTIVTRQRSFVAGNQKDWNKYVQPSAYVYDMQMHKSTNTNSLVLYSHGSLLDPLWCWAQIACLQLAMSRQTGDGYASVAGGRLLLCMPKPICICKNVWRSVRTTMTIRYTPNRSLYSIRECL